MPNYRKAARRAARRHGIDPRLFVRQIAAESGFDPNAGSPAGAQGIAQFMPATARGMGVNLHDNRVSDDLDAAARLMRSYVDKFGSYENALRAYNAGPAAVEKSRGYGETNAYVARILQGREPQTDGTPEPRDTGTQARTRTKTIPGVDRSADRQALMAQYLLTRGQPDALLALKAGLDQNADTPSRTITERVPRRAAKGAASATSNAGIATFDGKKVAAWIVPILKYARQRGWKGTITSGYRSDAEQTRIYNSGVRPAAVPKSLGGSGSKHEETGFLQGAIDVTDAATLAKILERKHSRLKYAGAKDPVHFSVPNPDGSY